MPMDEWGRFPFGQPNTVRPARMAKESDAVVIGVYPSAWHIAWRAPRTLIADGRSGAVAALAVDVEPTVFWDGNADDFEERVARWKRDVRFVDGKHGEVLALSPRTNGSSGEKVVRKYLEPLGIRADRATFTDVYPAFLVKTSNGRRREQGDAIRDEYDSIARRMELPVSSLPPRMPAARLPARAASTFGGRLVADLSAAAAPLIITLGAEVWDTLVAIPSLHARHPREKLTDLYGDAYGTAGSLTVNGRQTVWLPLAHPGLLKGNADPGSEVTAGRRTANGWATLHARWAAATAKSRAATQNP
jgi:hypothetical protein